MELETESTKVSYTAGIIAVLALWLVPLFFFVFGLNHLIGPDAYYHSQLAMEMKENGLILHDFTYATHSIWVNDWFDKEWLFHVIQVPFLSMGKMLGSQVYIIFLNLLLIAALFTYSRSLKCNIYQSLILIALTPWICWGVFWVRLVTCRPHLISIIILIFSIIAILKRKHILLAVLTIIYALSYTGHWQLLGLVLIADCLFYFFDETGKKRETFYKDFPLTVTCLLAMIIGNCIHPNFPNNIHGLYVQNVEVLFDSWTKSSSGDSRPMELRPINIFRFIPFSIILLIGLGFAIKFKRLKLSRNLYVLIIFTLIYIVLSRLSGRFLEYLTPVSILLAILLAKDLKIDWQEKRTVYSSLALGLAIIAYGAIGYNHYYSKYVDPFTQQKSPPMYLIGKFIQEHADEGELVVCTRWPEMSILWNMAPEQKQLLFLDPMYMKRYSKKHSNFLDQLRRGQLEYPMEIIKTEFGARFLVCHSESNALMGILKNRGNNPVFEDGDWFVYIFD